MCVQNVQNIIMFIYGSRGRRRNTDSSDVVGRLNVWTVSAVAGGGLVTVAAAAAATRARPVVAASAAHRNGYAPAVVVVRPPCLGRPARGGLDGVPSIRRLLCVRARPRTHTYEALNFITVVSLARVYSFADAPSIAHAVLRPVLIYASPHPLATPFALR